MYINVLTTYFTSECTLILQMVHYKIYQLVSNLHRKATIRKEPHLHNTSNKTQVLDVELSIFLYAITIRISLYIIFIAKIEAIINLTALLRPVTTSACGCCRYTFTFQL